MRVTTVAAVLGAITTALIPVASRLGLLRRRGGSAGYVLGAVRYRLGRFVDPVLAGHFAVRDYGRLLIGSMPTGMNLPGLEAGTLDVDRHYLPAQLRGSRATSTDASLLDREGAIVVLGEPGAGKSSLFQWLARRACDSCVRSPADARLPVRMSLVGNHPPADVADGQLGSWLLDVVRAEVAAVGAYRSEELFDLMASTRGVIVLLDGLDEVGLAQLDRTARMVAQLTLDLRRRSSKNLVAVGSRGQAFVLVQQQLQPVLTDVLRLLPLAESSVEAFVRAWPFGVDSPVTAQQILRARAKSPGVADLTRNPLMLGVYVLASVNVGADRGRAVSETRTSFLRTAVEELLHRRRSGQLSLGYGQVAVRERREEVLSRLAFSHLADPLQAANSMPVRDIVAAAQGVVASEEIDAFISDLALNTGLIDVEPRHGEATFAHLTICEYFAALACARSPARWDAYLQGCLTDEALRSRLITPLIMATALTPFADREVRLDELAVLEDPAVLIRAAEESQFFTCGVVRATVQAEFERLLDRVDDLTEGDIATALLLTSTINEANAVAGALHEGKAFDLDPVLLLTELVSASKERLLNLFGSLVATDVDAAVAVADPILGDPDWVIDLLAHSMPGPQLVATGLAHLAAGHVEQRDLWVNTLVIAALERPEVAAELASAAELEVLRGLCESVPSARRWTLSHAIGGSLYGQVLTLAVANARLRLLHGSRQLFHGREVAVPFVTSRDLVALLASCRPPRSRVVDWAQFLGQPPMLFTAVMCAVLGAVATFQSLHVLVVAALGVLGVALLWGGMTSAAAVHGRRSPSFVLLDLAPGPRDETYWIYLRMPRDVLPEYPLRGWERLGLGRVASGILQGWRRVRRPGTAGLTQTVKGVLTLLVAPPALLLLYLFLGSPVGRLAKVTAVADGLRSRRQGDGMWWQVDVSKVRRRGWVIDVEMVPGP